MELRRARSSTVQLYYTVQYWVRHSHSVALQHRLLVCLCAAIFEAEPTTERTSVHPMPLEWPKANGRLEGCGADARQG